MLHAELTHTVRELVCQTFAQLGLSSGSEPREAILVREGSYCGRRFELDTAHAVWLIDDDQVTVFGSDEEVLRVFTDISGAAASGRKAA